MSAVFSIQQTKNSMTINTLAHNPPLSETDIITLLLTAVKHVQARKRVNLIDEDDIGEFALEVKQLSIQGATELWGLMAIPSKREAKYKGGLVGTVIKWRQNPDRSETLQSVRHEQVSQHRFRAFLPADHPAILFPDGFNGCKFNPHIPTGYKRQRSIEGFAVVR